MSEALMNEVKLMRAEARNYYFSMMSFHAMVLNPNMEASDISSAVTKQLETVERVARESVFGYGS